MEVPMPEDSAGDAGAQAHMPVPGLPIQPQDLKPAYANAAQIQHSPYEFVLTFLRTEYLLQGQGPDGQTPVAVAARVAMSHRAMKEFLDAAIKNYEGYVDTDPEAPQLEVLDREVESA
jgi:hypothetical protein